MVQSWTVKTSVLPGAWNYPSWTLSVELLFYLCFPLLLPIVARVEQRGQIVKALCVVSLLSIALDGTQVSIGGRTAWLAAHLPLPIFRLPEFVLGMLVARYKPRDSSTGSRMLWLSGAAILILLTLNTHRFVTLIIVPYAALVWAVAYKQSRLKQWLETRVLVLLGGASYAIYLLQEPVLAWLRRWSGTSLGMAGVLWIYVPVLIVFGIAVFLTVEEPSRRLIRRAGRKHSDISGRTRSIRSRVG